MVSQQFDMQQRPTQASELAFSPYQTRGQVTLGRGIFKDQDRKIELLKEFA